MTYTLKIKHKKHIEYKGNYRTKEQAEKGAYLLREAVLDIKEQTPSEFKKQVGFVKVNVIKTEKKVPRRNKKGDLIKYHKR